jgi:hypothetical protein
MPETDLYTQEKLADPVRLVVSAVESCERRYHDAFVRRVERRYMAYRGLAEEPEPGGGKDTHGDVEEDWHSNVTTPYVLQTCEGMLATMLEPHPRFNVQPRPKPDEPIDQILDRMLKVDVIEDTIHYALDRDRFAEKQRDFMQQDMIAGISILKDYWHTEHRDVVQLVPDMIEIEDDAGNVIDTMTTHKEEVIKGALFRDDACSEVVDVRDFFWPSQAPSVQKAEYLVHRTWETYAALERSAKEYGYKNIEKLKGETARARQADITRREMKLRNIDRTQDLVEVLEYWTPERVVTVGNRTVLLKDRPNPLWNGRLPFIVCSSMPDAFQIPGFSVVEALAQLQEMLWTLQNQRLDVVRMLANMVTLIRSDVDDPEAFEWAPNAQWFVEDPGQVSQLQIDPTVANITIQAEELLKGDLQNIMGGLPMASGADSSTIDQETATGVSIITTIAQRIIQARKQHYLWSYAQLGKHYLLLYQQFLRDDRIVKVLGAAGAAAYKEVSPLDIQGDFDVSIDVTSDSLLRQERRAEAQSLMQMAAAIAPISTQLGAPLNLRAFWEKVLDAYDITDKERYFMPPAAAQATAAAAPPQLTGAPPAESSGNGGGAGVTNVPAAAGPMSPSNVGSMSPEVAMQRMMAMRGGMNNAPA